MTTAAKVLGDAGPVVVLLPGGAEAAEGFFPGIVEGLLADPGCRVVLWDRPGTGSAAVPGWLADAPDAVHTMLAALGLGPVVVVGQSLGGAVAAMLACAHPDDVAGLVLLDPTPVNEPSLARLSERLARVTAGIARLSAGRRLLLRMLRAEGERSISRHGMGPAAREATRRTAQLDLAQLHRAVRGLGDLARDFDESRLSPIPAVVVTADRKPTSGLRRAHQRLATRLGAPLLSWPGAEHAVHLTHTGQVLEAIRGVVRRVG